MRGVQQQLQQQPVLFPLLLLCTHQALKQPWQTTCTAPTQCLKKCLPSFELLCYNNKMMCTAPTQCLKKCLQFELLCYNSKTMCTVPPHCLILCLPQFELLCCNSEMMCTAPRQCLKLCLHQVEPLCYNMKVMCTAPTQCLKKCLLFDLLCYNSKIGPAAGLMQDVPLEKTASRLCDRD